MSLANLPTQEEQQRLLADALTVVKTQSHLMCKALDDQKLMESLKFCSVMLAELRTSALTPKNYYELYMAIFDALRHLTTFLVESHKMGRHKLSELYELVQYAGNIVPRLYLMITVGAVFMGIPEAPVKELMRDMIEMSRGVQHPTRGLFLRHYLSGMTRDKMPEGISQGPEGNLKDSITFILINFTEMNKLWVRLQHQGHSRDRDRRELERKELRILVGTNLVRLSQLEGVDLPVYKETILPAVLEQIIKCRDVIAQEYLMEVIVQVFQDDFHLWTLRPFLDTCKKLNPRVSIKNIIIGLIDRLTAYATREAEENPIDSDDEEEEDEDEEDEEKDEEEKDSNDENDDEEDKEKPSKEKKLLRRGIPKDVPLFDIFWEEITSVIKERPDITVPDVIAMLVSLVNLTLSCYPEKLENVDRVLAYTREKLASFQDSPDLMHQDTIKNMLALLRAPILAYPTVMTLMLLPNYEPLLVQQHYSSRRAIAHDIVNSILKHHTIIDTTDDVNGILTLCAVLIRDQKDCPMRPGNFASRQDEEDYIEEQSWMARLIHLFQGQNADEQFMLLSAVRKQLSDSGDRIRYTFPSVITQAVQLAQRYKLLEELDEDWRKKCEALFRFISQVIAVLYNKTECHELAFRLFLMASQSADQCGFEEQAYDFFVQALVVYEEAITESRAQFQAIVLLTGTLQSTRVFGTENYDKLTTTCVRYAGRLLKRPDSCRAICLCTHLFWHMPMASRGEDEAATLYRDEERVLELLKRAASLAEACLDPAVKIQLYVEILNRYIFYFENKSTTITTKEINLLIGEINEKFNDKKVSTRQPIPELPFVEPPLLHWLSTLLYLERRREEAASEDLHIYDEIETAITVRV
ncbi:vacuolar protein sorting-associated protein 35 [Syncephalis fuscata]|nr:vacuolar protein sorting-associated protein 35 [Syncephalis fuscata]